MSPGIYPLRADCAQDTRGTPTHLFFVLGLRYDELHLPWLAKLVQMLMQPEVVPALMDAPDEAALYERLTDAERKLEPALAEGA